MVRRCEKPQAEGYCRYGARGIAVCERWHDVRLFIQDIEGSLGPRPAGMTLDRINNDGNYEPGNVRWASRWEQQHNARRQVNGPSSRIPPRRAQSDERWLPVPSYAAWYEVSDFGNLWSLPRAATAGGPVGVKLANGYRTAVLSKYGQVRTVMVARVVLAAFRGSANGRRACHLGAKDDDRLLMLEWR